MARALATHGPQLRMQYPLVEITDPSAPCRTTIGALMEVLVEDGVLAGRCRGCRGALFPITLWCSAEGGRACSVCIHCGETVPQRIDAELADLLPRAAASIRVYDGGQFDFVPEDGGVRWSLDGPSNIFLSAVAEFGALAALGLPAPRYGRRNDAL